MQEKKNIPVNWDDYNRAQLSFTEPIATQLKRIPVPAHHPHEADDAREGKHSVVKWTVLHSGWLVRTLVLDGWIGGALQ